MDLNTLFTGFIDSLNLEIETRKQKATRRPYLIKDGAAISDDTSGKVYRFNGFSYNVFPDSPADVVIFDDPAHPEGKQHNATVIGVDDDVLSLYISGEDLPDAITRARLIVDDTKLLEGVRNTVKNIKSHEENPPQVVANAIFGIGEIKSGSEDYQDFPVDFNDSQRDTVRRALGSNATYVWGPPGTGKSVTLGFLAGILLKKQMSILITAHTNEAVDNLLEKLVDYFSPEAVAAGEIIRWRATRSEKLQGITPGAIVAGQMDKLNRQLIELRREKAGLLEQRAELQREYAGNKFKLPNLRRQHSSKPGPEGKIEAKLKNILKSIKRINANLAEISSKIIDLEEELEDIRNIEYELLEKARVVGTTLTSAALNAQLRERSFDAVIVDEVSMAPCPSLYTACSLAKRKVVLCGDFYQLSPIAENREAVWLSKSIYDQMGITSKIASGQDITTLTILDTQFRCHPKIADSIIDIVYHGKLKNGYAATHEKFEAQYREPYANEACVLLDLSKICTSSNPWCEKIGSSWVNANSAELTLKLTQQALASGIKSVGVITPYNAQARQIKEKIVFLKEIYPDSKIEAATVHRYQGREMDLIIFDLIDCYPKEDLAPFLRGSHGGESMRLINVATTRARGKLIVIANVAYIEQKLRDHKKAILYQWIQYLKTQRHIYLNSISELKYLM